ncbi:MAG TPA: prenyltransferase/squalene oxidase repeat-containing protein [Solirubrobacterales bacterium]|nr:prenyltransferase/squalene oxidase repeat-containing protein [Solirubrobacterales bacterium]
MTWEVASFLIVGAVILAGFAWYERSRPPAQVVALVAALAALAIAGRIAFAAFPNVKPTTDIVIFAGYALGGAPGFAVGALAGLVSNFWFGQGPWTPWQMAGWGLCGVLGALLALGVRNAGRLALAATCGFAGILYGALLNFSLMATYGGDLSLRHFLVLEARAVPFEIAHVAGNVALALLAGPAMVRMLTRFRERFEWRRAGSAPAPAPPRGGLGGALRSGGVAILLALALVALVPTPARADDSSVTRAAAWLAAQQRPSGGFPATPGQEAGAEMTSWAMLALAATGRNPLDVASGGKTPVDFLRSHIADVTDAGDVARTVLALSAAGVDPRSFAGENLVDQLLSRRAENGSYQGWPGTSAYAVLALRAAGANDAAAPTVAWLRDVQGKDGGWGNEPKGPSTAEITGAVLQVLTPGSEASDRALGYLRGAKRKNGGFSPGSNLAANAQATAWTSAGLLAAGKDPASFGDGKSSFAYMKSLQTDAGYFLKEPSLEATPVWVTADVLVPLTGNHLPVAAPPREPQPKTAQNSGGGSNPGGVPPSLSGALPRGLEPGSVPPELEKALGNALKGSGSKGGGKAGKIAPGAISEIPSTGGTGSEGDLGSLLPDGTAPQATAEQASESTSDSSSSTAGAILLGLLAGCVLFGAGLAGRAGWMRWRYGL